MHCVDSKQFRHAASLTQTLREQHLAYATTTNVVVSDAANLKGTSANCQVQFARPEVCWSSVRWA